MITLCIKFFTCVATEPAFQYEGGVRLVNGLYSSEGILEVFIFGMWYTICTEALPPDAATAVCTQLGYTNNVINSGRFVTISCVCIEIIMCILLYYV